MKTARLMLPGLVLVLGCGASGGNDKPANSAGAGSSGAGAGSGGNGGVSNPSGGMPGTSGSGTSGSGTSGAGTSGSGGAGTSGSSGAAGAAGAAGTTSQGFTCPATSAAPVLTVTPTRVMGVPPSDAFNNMNNDFTNIEGDVWIGDALYVSEINPGKGNGAPPPARILKITADDKVTILNPDTGSNGLAVDAMGQLFGALHKDGSISKLNLMTGAATPVVTQFMGMRFDSPNDLTIHKNGTIYFTDPDWQAPTPRPQAATRAYRVAPGGMPEALPDQLSQPNGITLSKNQDALFIGGNQLKKYPVMPDGSLGAGATFVNGVSTDGMAMDCGDNLYTAQGNKGVVVYSPAGMPLGTITVSGIADATNVAFGGMDHQTLYISGQGAGAMQKGLFKAKLNVAGFPY